MTLFILVVAIIALLFLFINLIFAPHNPYQEKYSIFECGFHSFLGQNRSQFGVKFFIYGLVYLLLDLEILLLFPFAMSEYVNDFYGLIIILVVTVIITIGFIFELGKGALKISSKQESSLTKDSISISKIPSIGKRYYSTSRKIIYNKNNMYKTKLYFLEVFNTIAVLSLIVSIYVLIFLYAKDIILINSLIVFQIFSILFWFSLVMLYLDGFRLSEIKIFKYIQIFTFTFIPVVLFIFSYGETILADFVLYAKDNDIDLHAHGHISVDKEAGKAIGTGLSTLGSQLGLGTTMAAIGSAVGASIAKSGMPPLQKAALIVGSAAAAGVGHSFISAANRDAVRTENSTTSAGEAANIGSHVSKLVDDSQISPLQEVLFNGEILNSIGLTVLYVLIIQFIYKLYIKEKINLNWSWFVGTNINNKFEFYFNKMIKLNKQMSIGWIWLGLTLIMLILGANFYVLYKLDMNLDSFIEGYISFNPNYLENVSYIPTKGIGNIISTLYMINIITLISCTLLIAGVIWKFHFNKNINNIFIWLAVIMLILALAFISFTFGDLYFHLDGYVKMYISLKNI